MVYRIYVEKKDGFDHEAQSLTKEVQDLLEIGSVESIRVINRYDVEDIDKDLFDYAVKTVFSEPQMDNATVSIESDNAKVFAVEYLPGQFDQRADSAAQCIQLISQKERPLVRTAKVYCVYGNVTEAELNQIKKHVINPVESRQASLAEVATLKQENEIPTEVQTLDGFIDLDRNGLAEFVKNYGLAMDTDDIAFCQQYFISEKRNPTITEIRMIDTYWSDHCRHTTFNTTIDSVKFEDALLQKTYEEYLDTRKELNRKKPINLMDMGTIAAKILKKQGYLNKLDESEEINACTVKIKVNVDGVDEDWLLLFKNETHNHPTEIEPFGGAATCIGGAIRDPLSGRSYVYAAMRVTGAADPLKAVKDTIKGKLPQRKIVTTAAAGYSSYGNQIGLATGQVDEMYHDGYVAKRLEIGAVIAAAPAKNVRRECPTPGDKIILIGGRTGRDGCGGATGSSKSHTQESLTKSGAEVQKGNAPEERKLQRLFRNEKAS
ncbi:MAG: phosphoribosylformylglycinamidine synthase, partial [Clostridia bacterium]|nr:phosphoribosylformylglycinamidine synthase [Clostridia bacterium]